MELQLSYSRADRLFTLFGIPADFKFKKQIIMTLNDFENKVLTERIRKSHSYDSLSLAGDKVRILWNKEENTLGVNGSYYYIVEHLLCTCLTTVTRIMYHLAN